MNFRIGSGFDVHATIPGDFVILGGVKISAPFSLAGHSDADVLLHAITDAVLGSVASGDIGVHFPDTLPENKNRDSSEFLLFAIEEAARKGYELGNLDAVILCEAPKIAPHRDEIIQKISDWFQVAQSAISIKATTTEKLGFTGRAEGIAAQASILMQKIKGN
ncbi:MAG: 2-C-methyl-D-erythritol 2,4-cyclodiphosphate synthase [Leptospirales bacterium]